MSIIDLSEGANQPMSDEEGRFHIVYNGEVYNFQSIRAELESLGVPFATSSDTEVILKAFKQWGPVCLERFIGMFAFCIYDERKDSFFLARDRLGKKPLFYSIQKGALIFASELKAILKTRMLETVVNTSAVNSYFSLGYIPGEKSIVNGVNKLPPAHYLQFGPGVTAKPVRYWDTPLPSEPLDEDEAKEELEALLKDSVRLRLISDVPLGAFLSGGIDSSLVAAFMSQVHSGSIKTFSVGFEGSISNELGYARQVAEHLGTEHAEIMLNPNVAEDLERISAALDEPIFDNSLLPTYYLSKATRQHATVALSGDGGDELFAGYIHYQSSEIARKLAKLAPYPFSRLAAIGASMLPEGFFGRNTLYGIAEGGERSFLIPGQVFREEERASLIRSDVLKGIDPIEPMTYRSSYMKKYEDFVNAMCYTDMATSLPNDILVKVDRASMFNSLEVRCPLLDHRLAELSFGRIPSSLKLQKGVKKYLLKQLALKYLPDGFELERKQGFDIPSDLMKRTSLPERLMEFTDNDYLDMKNVRALASRQRKSKGRLWHKLFAIYFFLRWVETWT